MVEAIPDEACRFHGPGVKSLTFWVHRSELERIMKVLPWNILLDYSGHLIRVNTQLSKVENSASFSVSKITYIKQVVSHPETARQICGTLTLSGTKCMVEAILDEACLFQGPGVKSLSLGAPQI